MVVDVKGPGVVRRSGRATPPFLTLVGSKPCLPALSGHSPHQHAERGVVPVAGPHAGLRRDRAAASATRSSLF